MADGLTIEVDEAKLADVRRRLTRIANGVGLAIAGAANDTAKSLKSSMSSAIRERVNIKKKDLDGNIHIAGASSHDANPTATITLKKRGRLPLKYFGARQTSRGVTYRIGTSGSRTLAEGAFIIEKYDGNAYRRRGKKRFPLRKLKGPSAWGVFVKSGLMQPTLQEARQLMDKNIEDRVRYLLLKASGGIAA